MTDGATGLPVAAACVTLGPPRACWTKSDDQGRYVIDLAAVMGQPGWFELYVLRNDREPKYRPSHSGAFEVRGVAHRDFALEKE